MPALTSSSVGSSATSDAEGTTVCPRASKKRRNRSRICADFIGRRSSLVLVQLAVIWWVDAERFTQLDLSLGGVVLDLRPPHRQAISDPTSLRGDALGSP